MTTSVSPPRAEVVFVRLSTLEKAAVLAGAAELEVSQAEFARMALLQATRHLWKCRVCGCTDDACEWCIEKLGEACHWVEFNLCSACHPNSGENHGEL